MNIPLTPEQNNALRNAFRPHAPIEDPDNFVGRETERDRVTEAVFEPGLQVIVFGERGAGKTSLANVATAATKFERVQIFCEQKASFTQICRDILLKYSEINPSVIKYNAISDTIEADGIIISANDLTGNLLLRVLPKNKPLCIILDELDRIENKQVIADLSELAKNISTYSTNLTMIFVGVAATADGLLTGHISNFRNLRQVPVDRMSDKELREVIKRGETILQMEFQPNVIDEILQLCDQFPYYVHLLATNSAKSALLQRKQKITEEDLAVGIAQAAADADQSLRDDYEHSTLSIQRSQIYRRILWSMATLPGAAQTIRTITEGTNEIAKAEGAASVTVQSVGQALVTLTKEGKKNMLVSRTQGFYTFSNPLMKGYVRLIRAKA